MKYFIIIIDDKYCFDSCGGKYNTIIEKLKNSDLFNEYGFAKLTISSLLLKSNKNLEFWRKYLENLNCGSYIISEINLLKNSITGRSDQITWDWITNNKKDESLCINQTLICCNND